MVYCSSCGKITQKIAPNEKIFLILEGAIGHLVEYQTTNHDFKSSFEEVESF